MLGKVLIFVFAFALFGGAWWIQTRAAAAAECPAGADAPAPPAPAPTRALDEYGNIRWDDEKARLDNLAIEVQNDPRALGHITCYGGRVGRPGAARRRCERAKSYLVNTRGIDASRVVIVDGGYREEQTVVLWAVPPGVTMQPSPTIDPSEVRYIKGKTKRAARRGRLR